MQHHSNEPRKQAEQEQPAALPPMPRILDTPAPSAPLNPQNGRPSRNYLPRELPVDAPPRIKFGSRLVLYKREETKDMMLYITHIKGKPTYIFVMGKLDPATAISWKGAFHGRAGVILADRDGVVKDSRFLNDTDKAKAADVMVPTSLQAAKEAHLANIGIGIVTNQGGYQTGQASFEDTIAINVRVIQQIANAGGHVDAVFICPFAKALATTTPGVLDARKPGPAMFVYAEQLAAVDGVPVLAATGDQRTDGAAAQAAGQMFYAITGPSGRWQDELLAAKKHGETLPVLNENPNAYKEVVEFADVVKAVLSKPKGKGKGKGKR